MFYHGVRNDVSLLLSNGHTYARDYPVVVVWSEARLVRRREAIRMQRESMLIMAAISTAIAGGDSFENLLDEVGNVG